MKKHVDFVLCNPRTTAPTLTIEPGDCHEADDRRERYELVDANGQTAKRSVALPKTDATHEHKEGDGHKH